MNNDCDRAPIEILSPDRDLVIGRSAIIPVGIILLASNIHG